MTEWTDPEVSVLPEGLDGSQAEIERRLRVLMLAATAIHGGHVVQMEKTAEFLKDLGLEVTVSDGAGAEMGAYDIVHAFGAPRRFRHVFREARQAGSSVVSSPIFWEYRSAQTTAGRIWRSAIRASRVTVSSLRRGIDETAAELRRSLEETATTLELADLLLPNSQGEAERIRSTFSVTAPIHVVPNGFDPSVFFPPDVSVQRQGIVCVARLEPHKNQLELIKALDGSGIPLTIIGDEHPHHRGYATLCRSRAGANVVFRSALSQPEVAEVFRSAAVHVLPSWFETTGLVSLEAAACGCAVVTTSRGDAREYFGDLAVYCDPARKGSIRAAVEQALAAGPPPELAARVRESFTWNDAAKATFDAYLAMTRHRAASGEWPQ